MYLLGLYLDVPAERISFYTELGVWTTAAVLHALSIRTTVRSMKHAEEKGGRVTRLPNAWLAKLASALLPLGMFLAPLVYVVSVPFNGFTQPGWWARWALPDGGLGAEEKALVRAGSCAVLVVLWNLMVQTAKTLDTQIHGIGIRERPKVVSTGAYAFIRHPAYTIGLCNCAVFAGMLWSYIPLAASVVAVLALLVKIPYEEELLETDEKIGAEYREYKKKVPYRIIPYIY